MGMKALPERKPNCINPGQCSQLVAEGMRESRNTVPKSGEPYGLALFRNPFRYLGARRIFTSCMIWNHASWCGKFKNAMEGGNQAPRVTVSEEARGSPHG